MTRSLAHHGLKQTEALVDEGERARDRNRVIDREREGIHMCVHELRDIPWELGAEMRLLMLQLVTVVVERAMRECVLIIMLVCGNWNQNLAVEVCLL